MVRNAVRLSANVQPHLQRLSHRKYVEKSTLVTPSVTMIGHITFNTQNAAKYRPERPTQTSPEELTALRRPTSWKTDYREQDKDGREDGTEGE